MLNSNSSTILFLQEEVLGGATPDLWDLRTEGAIWAVTELLVLNCAK